MERLFTLDEARALLPALRELLSRLSRARDAVQAEGTVSEAIVSSNGSAAAAARGSEAQRTLARLVAELEGLGVMVRDIDSGIVDFAATRDDKPIYLCWRLGEDDVAHWHPRDTGFMGRQPL